MLRNAPLETHSARQQHDLLLAQVGAEKLFALLPHYQPFEQPLIHCAVCWNVPQFAMFVRVNLYNYSKECRVVQVIHILVYFLFAPFSQPNIIYFRYFYSVELAEFSPPLV